MLANDFRFGRVARLRPQGRSRSQQKSALLLISLPRLQPPPPLPAPFREHPTLSWHFLSSFRPRENKNGLTLSSFKQIYLCMGLFKDLKLNFWVNGRFSFPLPCIGKFTSILWRIIISCVFFNISIWQEAGLFGKYSIIYLKTPSLGKNSWVGSAGIAGGESRVSVHNNLFSWRKVGFSRKKSDKLTYFSSGLSESERPAV